MKKYRIKIALIAALALILTAAVPALAATTTRITGAYEEPDIQVLIPTAGQAVINPYKLPVKVTADEPDDTVELEVKTGNQIATRPLVGVNLGKVALKVGAKVSAETRGDFRFSSTAIAKTDKTKSGMVYFQLNNPSKVGNGSYTLDCDVETDTTTGEKSLKKTTNTVCNGIKFPGVKQALQGWDSTYVKADDLLLGSASVEKLEMAEIAAVDAAGKPQCSATADSYFLARVAGEVVTLPNEDWRTSDGFTATVTWVIQPASN